MINTQNSQEGERDNLHPSSIPEATYVDIDLRGAQDSTYAEPSVRISPITVPPEPIRQPPMYHISVVPVPHNEEELFKIFTYRKSLKFFIHMILKKLSLTNYKSIDAFELNFNPSTLQNRMKCVVFAEGSLEVHRED